MHHKKGFALLSAIFILAILSIVSAYLINMYMISNQTTMYAQEGARAYYSARSGIEWGIRQLVIDDSSCPADTTINLTQGGSSGFLVFVSCTSSSYTEATTIFNVFDLNARASRGVFGTIDYVSRSLSVKVTIPD